MSTVNATTLRDRVSGDEGAVIDAIYGSAKAWVRFSGAGTVSIAADYNVDSITDNGTGNFLVNFTNAMPDANYSWVGLARRASSGSLSAVVTAINSVPDSTNSLGVLCLGRDLNTPVDAIDIMITVNGN